MDDQLLEINASPVMEKYEWYQNGVKITGGKYLDFYGIDQQQHSGIYKCSIILNNGQIIESESFNLTVYNCK
jgi:hypothetical protein